MPYDWQALFPIEKVDFGPIREFANEPTNDAVFWIVPENDYVTNVFPLFDEEIDRSVAGRVDAATGAIVSQMLDQVVLEFKQPEVPMLYGMLDKFFPLCVDLAGPDVDGRNNVRITLQDVIDYGLSSEIRKLAMEVATERKLDSIESLVKAMKPGEAAKLVLRPGQRDLTTALDRVYGRHGSGRSPLAGNPLQPIKTDADFKLIVLGHCDENEAIARLRAQQAKVRTEQSSARAKAGRFNPAQAFGA